MHRSLCTPMALALCVLVAGSGTAEAAVAWLGDVNQDSVLDAADVEAAIAVLADQAAATAEERTFADANNDGILSITDVIYLQDVLLDLQQPHLVVSHVDGIAVSFWKQEAAPAEATEVDVPLGGIGVSFWKGDLVPAATEADTQTLGAVSFWRGELVPAATEADTQVLGSVSFWKGELVPAASEVDTRTLGNPSFLRQ